MSVTEIPLEPSVDDCPAWCEGCDDDGVHVTDYAGADGTRPDDGALARLRQEHGGEAEIELGVNDADGDSALMRLTPAGARELAYILLDLADAAQEG